MADPAAPPPSFKRWKLRRDGVMVPNADGRWYWADEVDRKLAAAPVPPPPAPSGGPE